MSERKRQRVYQRLLNSNSGTELGEIETGTVESREFPGAILGLRRSGSSGEGV